MVPDGWETKKLGQLVSIKHGFSFSSEFFSSKGDFALLTPGNFFDAGGYRALGEKQKFFVGQIPREYVLKSGDMLVAMTEQAAGLLGATLFVPSGMTFLHNQRLGLIENTFVDSLDLNFLHSLLSTGKLRQRISAEAGGTKVKHTSPVKLLNLDVLIPPLPEQKKIAEILSTWDRAIAVAERQLENAKAQKKALMQQLLTGKHRLPGFEGEWKSVKLGDAVEIVTRRNDNSGLPITMISSKRGFVRQDEKYSRYMAGESAKRYTVLKKGEFAYNKGNSLSFRFGCIFRLDDFEAALVPHVYFCFKLHEKLNSDFYLHLFEADYLKPQLSRLVNTGVRNNGLLNIKSKEFWGVSIPIPSEEEQSNIAEILGTMTDIGKENEEKLVHLRTEKRALMQQLLTGKRRVKVDA